jgi:hypothetical protein
MAIWYLNQTVDVKGSVEKFTGPSLGKLRATLKAIDAPTGPELATMPTGLGQALDLDP